MLLLLLLSKMVVVVVVVPVASGRFPWYELGGVGVHQ